MATKTFRRQVERSLKQTATRPYVCLDTPGAVYVATLLADEQHVQIEMREDLGMTSRFHTVHEGLAVDDLLDHSLEDADGGISLGARFLVEPDEVVRLRDWLGTLVEQSRPPQAAPLGSRSRPSVFASRGAASS